MSSYQIAEWQAYNQLEPIGPWVDDFKWATILAHFTNVLTWAHSKKGHGTKYSAEDFMPNWTGEEKPVKKQSWQQMKDFLLKFAEEQNKRVANRERRNKVTPKTKSNGV